MPGILHRVGENSTPRVGRPRTFDHQVVLGQVAALYWQQGVAATSVPDLERATGLGRSSLYNAFGEKHALFTAALGAYVAQVRAHMLDPLLGGSAGLADLHAFLDRLAVVLGGPLGEHGCLAVATMAEVAGREPDVRGLTDEYAGALRAGAHAAFVRAERAGELRPAADTAAAADALLLGVAGVNVLARGGADRDRRLALVDALRTQLDLLAADPKIASRARFRTSHGNDANCA